MHETNISSNETFFVGIDVASRWLDVWIEPIAECRRFANDDTGISELINWLSSYRIATVAMEATGRLERLSAKALSNAGYRVAVLNPSQVSGFRQAMGQIAKTDQLDAKAIAMFASTMPVHNRELPDESIEELKDLGARFRQITRMLTAERNRLRRTTQRLSKSSIEGTIEFLKAEKEAIGEAMKALVRQNQNLRHRYDILTSIPGIGPQTALTLISELPEIGSLSGKQIAALAGVAPMNSDSGTKIRRARLRGGRKSVRTILYMAAMSAQRYNPVIKKFYGKLVEAGKPGMVAIAAVMRKLLVIANSMIANNNYWQQT